MSTLKVRKYYGLALLPAIVLGGCAVAPPSGPTVTALPGQGKSWPQFQQDDAMCRNYAASREDTGAEAANAQNNAVGTAVAGTLIGAAAGAALGSLGGNVGAGAAIGAGAGLAGGSMVAGNNEQGAQYSMQQRYDIAYSQCMVGNGNTLQQYPMGYYAPPPGYYYGPPPG
jgi:hypothetical protein